ncbi:diadenylate cyclase [Alicyclobacillus sp. SO9]|uniref:diadenylate cyclase n=1 Tax=Alicyclobacillus sp. SO9 TaxID=2665646 RepID=UPI0018E6DD97|nr:diadenylate cyclase [Alicyclobacillus sp. SO9]
MERYNPADIGEQIDEVTTVSRKNTQFGFKSRVLYVNDLTSGVGRAKKQIIYLLEIRNIGLEASEVWHKSPSLSFLRMVLDYFFYDYFVQSKTRVVKNKKEVELLKKYKEDGAQFIRRVARVYFGMIQELLQESKRTGDIGSVVTAENSQYYMNNLLEKIDDISTRTYEGNNPFGSILIMSEDTLNSSESLVNYVIKFRDDDRIPLDDSKRIRKLLEPTNGQTNLSLIADHRLVYGMGSINWADIDEELLFDVQVKGLSKYSLSLIVTNEKLSRYGTLVTENDTTIYKTERKLEILRRVLIDVVFKTPKIGENGYTPERFKRLVESQFYEDDSEFYASKVENLEKVVRKAAEQKYGTIVVITDTDTAAKEVTTLKMQSTLIEPTPIKLEHVRHLTSIDGAIYFDTNGNCHAIGVILDGIAKEGIGDSSRGARYNSAYRYMEKLKSMDKKCVIAIISEDGMVNLIPELDDEDKVFTLFQQIIDLINEEDEDKIEALSAFQDEVLNYHDIDFDLFMKVADAHFSKEEYEDTIEFVNKGLESARNSYVQTKYYRLLAQAHYRAAMAQRSSNVEKYLYHMNQVIDASNLFLDRDPEEELVANDFNVRAIAFHNVLEMTEDEHKRRLYSDMSESDYDRAIELEPSSAIIRANRAILLNALGRMDAALDDWVVAELLEKDGTYVEKIMNVLRENINLLEGCYDTYEKVKVSLEDSAQLSDAFKNLLGELEMQDPSIAATLRDSDD